MNSSGQLWEQNCRQDYAHICTGNLVQIHLVPIAGVLRHALKCIVAVPSEGFTPGEAKVQANIRLPFGPPCLQHWCKSTCPRRRVYFLQGPPRVCELCVHLNLSIPARQPAEAVHKAASHCPWAIGVQCMSRVSCWHELHCQITQCVCIALEP